MAWTVLLLTLLTQATGSWTQSSLTEPSSVSGNLGQSVIISCAGTNNDIGGYNYPDTSRTPDKTPKLLIHAVSFRPSGIADCFSGSKSGNTATLTISGLKPEDEAEYYCGSYRSGNTYHSGASPWGSETRTGSVLTEYLLLSTCFPVRRGFLQYGLGNLFLSRSSPYPIMKCRSEGVPRIGHWNRSMWTRYQVSSRNCQKLELQICCFLPPSALQQLSMNNSVLWGDRDVYSWRIMMLVHGPYQDNLVHNLVHNHITWTHSHNLFRMVHYPQSPQR